MPLGERGAVTAVGGAAAAGAVHSVPSAASTNQQLCERLWHTAVYCL